MTKEQQDMAWGNMPEVVKEYARDLFSNSHIPQYEVLLGLIFGSHNLEADTRKPEFKVGNGYFNFPLENVEQCAANDSEPAETDKGNSGFNGCGSFLDMPYHEVQRMELAKAVAIAYAEKGRYEPSEIGAKAVEVADGVVDRLKKKRQCR